MLVFLKNRPIGVIRGSFVILNAGPSTSFKSSSSACFASASGSIVRNLQIRNLRLWIPSLSCRKKTGPGEVVLINRATMRKRGERRSIRASDNTKSIVRFTTAGQPSIVAVDKVNRYSPSNWPDFDFACLRLNRSDRNRTMIPCSSHCPTIADARG